MSSYEGATTRPENLHTSEIFIINTFRVSLPDRLTSIPNGATHFFGPGTISDSRLANEFLRLVLFSTFKNAGREYLKTGHDIEENTGFIQEWINALNDIAPLQLGINGDGEPYSWGDLIEREANLLLRKPGDFDEPRDVSGEFIELPRFITYDAR